jgi:hypothetical protein
VELGDRYFLPPIDVLPTFDVDSCFVFGVMVDVCLVSSCSYMPTTAPLPCSEGMLFFELRLS